MTDSTEILGPQNPQASAKTPVLIRWGGVVWGLLLIAFAAATLWVVSSAERVTGIGSWFGSLTPGSAQALAAAVVGVIIVVSALLGGVRSAQRRRARAGD